jgi:hypothetical protein
LSSHARTSDFAACVAEVADEAEMAETADDSSAQACPQIIAARTNALCAIDFMVSP